MPFAIASGFDAVGEGGRGGGRGVLPVPGAPRLDDSRAPPPTIDPCDELVTLVADLSSSGSPERNQRTGHGAAAETAAAAASSRLPTWMSGPVCRA